jgi:hypothetical protein
VHDGEHKVYFLVACVPMLCGRTVLNTQDEHPRKLIVLAGGDESEGGTRY